jgi:hypothetical protein
MKKIILAIMGIGFLVSTQSCKEFFGSKKNPTVEEIFEEGAIDPTLIPSEVAYVPILPQWNFFNQPVDVYVGYDEMVYVVDAVGLRVVEPNGNLRKTIPIPNAHSVVQDRRLHTYVSGTIDTTINDFRYTLPCVYHFTNTATLIGPILEDVLVQPYLDASRQNSPIRLSDTFPNVQITGLATTAENILYVARRGPRNDLTSPQRTDNNILFFDKDGNNIGNANGLNPVVPSLRSMLNVNGICGFATPPQQLFGVSFSRDYILTQGGKDNNDINSNIEYNVLWIKQEQDPDGSTFYNGNSSLLSFDTSLSDKFLYESFKFKNPSDVWVSSDSRGYLFVVDSETDSFYMFQRNGYEGVPPLPTSGRTKTINVSFGGRGAGVFQFNQPSGVCYNRSTVYIADKGNNRVVRFILNTDLE